MTPQLPGRPDDDFEHDGLITKRLLRAAAFAHLRPATGELLWDVGTGSGAMAVEWALAAEGARAVALERNPDRCERAARNLHRHRVADRVRLLGGDAASLVPDLLREPARPDAVFVGGGATSGVLDACWDALRPGGRMVLHAVTLEGEQLAFDLWCRHGGELTRLQLDHAEPLGRFTGWRPSRPVVQWAATRPAVAP